MKMDQKERRKDLELGLHENESGEQWVRTSVSNQENRSTEDEGRKAWGVCSRSSFGFSREHPP